MRPHAACFVRALESYASINQSPWRLAFLTPCEIEKSVRWHLVCTVRSYSLKYSELKNKVTRNKNAGRGGRCCGNHLPPTLLRPGVTFYTQTHTHTHTHTHTPYPCAQRSQRCLQSSFSANVQAFITVRMSKCMYVCMCLCMLNSEFLCLNVCMCVCMLNSEFLSLFAANSSPHVVWRKTLLNHINPKP